MRKISATVVVALFFCSIISCSTEKKTSSDLYASYPEGFKKLLQAHGGLENWHSFETLEFDLYDPEDSSEEHHIIDLKSRRDLVQGDSFKIGYNGKDVWVAPSKKAFKGRSARFYHNLYFYFFSIPYVLADPGINYKEETVTLDSAEFDCIQATFEAGVGDSDKDYYKMIIDPETNRLTSLLYTVTYYSGEAHEKYNLLTYQDWQEKDGLSFPGKLVWYKFENGLTGEKRGEAIFKNISLKKDSYPASMFEIPAIAEVDSLIKR